MGYFSNATEGMSFDEKYCAHCLNMPKREDRDCPVRSAHLLFAYEECGSTSNAKKILDMLIVPGPKGQRCAMFIDKREKQETDLPERPRLIEGWPK
jgi:hypothetical protein